MPVPPTGRIPFDAWRLSRRGFLAAAIAGGFALTAGTQQCRDSTSTGGAGPAAIRPGTRHQHPGQGAIPHSSNIEARAASEFPRLAGYLIGASQGSTNPNQPAFQQAIGTTLDLAILGLWYGWTTDYNTTYQQVASQIKAHNPSILLGNYTLNQACPDNASSPQYGYLYTKCSSQVGPNGVGDWFLYLANGQHSTNNGDDAAGYWDVNLTNLGTPDASGYTFMQWKAHDDSTRLFPPAGEGFDIWFSDNLWYQCGAAVDFDRTGTNQAVGSAQGRTWWREGNQTYLQLARSIRPDLMLVVNPDNDLGSGTYPPNKEDVFTHYGHGSPYISGAIMEAVIGESSWSCESLYSWPTIISWYQTMLTNLAPPQIIVFNIHMTANGTSDYQTMRYGFATCLVAGDGYFSISENGDYCDLLVYDEFTAGTGSNKWLGTPIDPPQTAAWSNGVWRRRFTGGVVLCNPPGNGSQTVNPGPGYTRFSGSQAPSINNGAAVTGTVTLADRDGLFLVGVP